MPEQLIIATRVQRLVVATRGAQGPPGPAGDELGTLTELVMSCADDATSHTVRIIKVGAEYVIQVSDS
jgi:hypothetical protein